MVCDVCEVCSVEELENGLKDGTWSLSGEEVRSICPSELPTTITGEEGFSLLEIEPVGWPLGVGNGGTSGALLKRPLEKRAFVFGAETTRRINLAATDPELVPLSFACPNGIGLEELADGSRFGLAGVRGDAAPLDENDDEPSLFFLPPPVLDAPSALDGGAVEGVKSVATLPRPRYFSLLLLSCLPLPAGADKGAEKNRLLRFPIPSGPPLGERVDAALPCKLPSVGRK